MTLFFADLVREFSYGTGAGPLPLGGALPGHRRFGDVVPAGAAFHYCIAGVTHPDEWETGEGTIADGLLVRDVLDSSEGGNAVAFAAGLKTVALTATARWFADQVEGGGPVAIGDVEGLIAALAGKAAAEHGHDYQAASAELTALAALSGTAFGRALLTLANAAGLRAAAELGTAAVKNVGSSGDALPRLDQANSWSAQQVFALIRIASGNPEIALLDTDTSGTDALGGFVMRDSTNTIRMYVGKPFAGGEVYFENADNGFRWTSGYSTKMVLDTASSRLDLGSGYIIRINSQQVVGPRITGWVVPAGTAIRTSFDTATVTTAQLAERVKALIDDLIAHGLIGA